MNTDPKLPFLDEARSAERMVELFNERILPPLYPGQRLARLKNQRTFYTPGERCLMLYSLWPHDENASDEVAGPALPPFALLSFKANGDVEQDYREHYTASDAPVKFLDDLGVLVEFFPMDWKLPGLRLGTDMTRMAPLLDEAAGKTPAGGSRPGTWSYTVPRYHPRVRCVFQYTNGGTPEQPTRPIIGKTYSRAKKAKKVWSVLGALHEFAAARGEWRVPEPLAYVDDANFMLMEFVSGTAMAHVICAEQADPGHCATMVETAGRIVAEMHKLPMRDLPAREVEKGRNKTRWRTERMKGFIPELAREIVDLLDEIDARADDAPPPRETFIHGSPSPKQFLVDGERMSLLDFDGAHIGDPALDVAVFLATMCKYRQKAADPSVLEGLDERFLEAYASVSGDRETTRRARLIQAQDLVGYAVRRIARAPFEYTQSSKKPNKPNKPILLLEESRKCLAAL